MKCPNCGANVEGVYCMYCGAKLGNEAPQSTPEALFRIRELEINREREIEREKQKEKEEYQQKIEKKKKNAHLNNILRKVLIFGSIILLIYTRKLFFLITLIVGFTIKKKDTDL